MTDAVKRDYHSDLRAAQARETKRGVVDAAAALFVDVGYTSTTVDAIAARAGVSRKTVFTAVGGKAELLKLAFDWAIAGDDEPVSVSERPDVVRLMQDDDPAVILTSWAAVLVGIDRRVAGLFRALEVAADADDGARALLATLNRQRLQGARAVVGRLAELDALAPGLDHDAAVDVTWLASDPALFDRLVRQRRWSARRFEKWLAACLISSLLLPGVAADYPPDRDDDGATMQR